MSPLLSGLFIEQFQAMLAKECPGIGVFTLKGGRLKDITYADDIALMVHSLAELQLLIDCLKKNARKWGWRSIWIKLRGCFFQTKSGP